MSSSESMVSCSDEWETNTYYDNISKALEATNGKLNSCHLEANSIKNQLNRRQSLGERYDSVQAADQTARQRLAFIQKEVKSPSERILNNSDVEVQFKNTLERNASMHALCEKLSVKTVALQKEVEEIDVMKAQQQAEIATRTQLLKGIEGMQAALINYNASEETKKTLIRVTAETQLENNVLRKDILELKERQTIFEVLDGKYNQAKGEKQGICLENHTLRQDIEKIHKELENKIAIQEMLDRMNASKEEERRQNEALQIEKIQLEIRLLQVEGLKESYNLANAETDSIPQQNEALRENIKDLRQELQKENAAQEKLDEMKKSKEAMCLQNDTLQQEASTSYKEELVHKKVFSKKNNLLQNRIEDLKAVQHKQGLREECEAMRTSIDAMNSGKETLQQQLKDVNKQNLKILEDLHREASNRVDVLQGGNVSLQQSINDVRNEQIRMRLHFKGKFEQLEASEEPLQAEKSRLGITLALVQEQCLSESDWQQKYIIQKGLTDTLQTKIEKTMEDITFFQDKLRSQNVFEAQYKFMKTLKKVASKQNNNLRKHLNNVQKKCGNEHTLQEKISAIQEETRTLRSQNQEHQDQINTLTDMLILYDFLRAGNSAMTQDEENLLKDLQEITKGVKRRAQVARR
ncbi:hypothetical protein OYC64_011490 [Pagothenia borchgrevinki]|uniref:Uncharacterized protein n=1 Tax=Pagothenia borchgrevinki TaxID=8213 RepID=A0ABD2FFJ6_PAGBO